MMPNLDYTAWRFWFDVAQTLGGIVLGFYVWWVNRKNNTDKRFKKIEASMTAAIQAFEEEIDGRCQKRLGRIEAVEKEERATQLKVGQMPSHRDIRELSGRINQLHGTMSELNGRLTGINRAVDLINEFLIHQGGRGAS